MARTRALIVSLACAALASCVSPAERLAQESAQCTAYGFKQGSPPFAQCMFTLDQAAADRAAMRRAAVAGALANQGAAYTAQAQQPQPQTCWSRPVGGSVVTTCN